MVSLSTLKLSLISSRKDIVDFCRNLLETKSSFRVESRLTDSFLSKSRFFLIDAEVLMNCSSDFLAKVKENSNRVLLLISADASEEVIDFCDSISSTVVTFPISDNHFMHYIKRMIEQFDASNGENNKKCNNCEEVIPDSLMGCFIGNSALIKQVRRKIVIAARHDTSVLLLGETGTGKSKAAEIIHLLSRRKAFPFQSQNVSTISDELACSKLFGTINGAYTDAVATEGLYKLADGGTLFLDEIGMASPALQAILLTAIETGIIQKVGSGKSEKVDVRTIFATNASIKKMMEMGTFRSDLYFRISDDIIHVPSLRDRKEDLRMISEDYALRNDRILTEEALEKIENYDWPGNIRELNSCLARAFRNSGTKEVSPENLDFGLFD